MHGMTVQASVWLRATAMEISAVQWASEGLYFLYCIMRRPRVTVIAREGMASSAQQYASRTGGLFSFVLASSKHQWDELNQNQRGFLQYQRN